MSQTQTIDVHHHVYPPRFLKENQARLLADSPNIPTGRYIDWTPQRSLEQMDRYGIATAIGSINSPGVWIRADLEKGRALAREYNEFGADLHRDFPQRFGMFASIPLPDVEGSLAETEYAFDVLKLDGIGLFSNYDGRYLGDAHFVPVYEELNRRKAVVFVHPIMALESTPITEIDPGIIELVVDTTRTIASLAYSGALARFPEIRFIFPHAGGLIAMITSRIEFASSTQARYSPEQRAKLLPHGLAHELGKLHYDTAGTLTNPSALAALVAMAPLSRILFGSDFPFGSLKQVELLDRMASSAEDLSAVHRGNAARLFPRFG